MKPDLTQAPAAVAEYVAAISAPVNDFARRQAASRESINACLARNGVIADAAMLIPYEGPAIWYACLVRADRVHEVSELEKRLFRRPGLGRTERHITLMNTPGSSHYNTVVGRVFRELVAQPVEKKRRAS